MLFIISDHFIKSSVLVCVSGVKNEVIRRAHFVFALSQICEQHKTALTRGIFINLCPYAFNTVMAELWLTAVDAADTCP